ncbi:monooxygenase FAD-binding protein [Hyaloraphidium curvatum]|nr:monooxygenase FAD-binding protein [Hyaloraphidium curvatum]
MTNTPETLPVLVVGAGPVGLTTAALLGAWNIPLRFVDKAAQPTDKSKALVLWPRTMELLASLGIAGPFRAAGTPVRAVGIHSNGAPLAAIPFGAEHLPDTQYRSPNMIAQSETERLLNAHLVESGVAVERPAELLGFRDEGAQVEATLRLADGREEVVRCAYILGCDGAHSAVRKLAGIPFSGSATPNYWWLADVKVEGDLPDDEISIFFSVHGTLVFFPFGGRVRVIADRGEMLDAEKPESFTVADMQRIVDERAPRGLKLYDEVWLSGFRINERMVEDYRKGRVILAGDAAHIHSPAGGQGMNTGMQDAFNLVWKLALTYKGLAHPSLLDTYSRERKAVGRAVLSRAEEMTFAATLRNPVARMVRDWAVSAALSFGFAKRAMVRFLTELSVGYPGSPMNGTGDGRGGIAVGDRVPDLEVQATDGPRLHDFLGATSCHLILFTSKDEDRQAITDLAEKCRSAFPGLVEVIKIGGEAKDGELGDPDGAVATTLGAPVALVRPDGYLAYRGSADPNQLLEYLSRFLVRAS